MSNDPNSFFGDSESKNVLGKCLVIDDEITVNTIRRKSFCLQLKLPKEYVIFASNHEDALKIIQTESDVATFFLDLRIPKNSYDSYDYSELPEWGINLIPAINEFSKYSSIYVYSAYVTKSYLKEKAESYNNIVGYLGKLDDEKNKRQLYELGNQRWLAYKNFSYIELANPETLVFLSEETAKLHKLLKRTAQDLVNIGTSLNKVKERLEYGKFTKWLEAEFTMSERTAQRLMKVANTFTPDTVAGLDILPSALYELSKTTTPETVIEEAIAKAKQGETISRPLIKTIKDNYSFKNKETQSSSKLAKRIREKTLPKQDLSQNESDLSSLTVKPQAQSNNQKLEQKQEIVRVVRRQNTWQLGKHLLFCGDPNSAQFIKLLPTKIALNLAFSLDRSWLFSQIDRIDSSINFSTKYQSELEPILLGETVERIIKLTTDLDDAISICFLPDPIILQVAHKLGCVCFIAEPDRLKCEALIKLWDNFDE